MKARLPWLKLWHEARSDLKLRSLTDAQFRVWFNLLCYASEQAERGVIEVSDPDLLSVEVSGGDLPLLQETLNRLVALRVTVVVTRHVTRDDRHGASRDRHENTVTIVTQNVTLRRDDFVTIRFANFEKRNADVTTDGAMTAAERARKYRQRKKLEKPIPTTVTDRHATVTGSSHASTDSIVTPRHGASPRTRVDGEGELEKQRRPAPAPAPAHAREAGPAAAPPPPAPPTGTPTAPALRPAPAPGDTAPAVPPFPAEDGALDVHTGPHEVPRPEAEAIWGLLWRTWPGCTRLAHGWYEHQRWYPPDRWRAAIREAARRGDRPGSVKYLERLAADPKVGAAESPPAHANGHPSPPRRAAPSYFISPPGAAKRYRGTPAPGGEPSSETGPKGLEP